jgi:serine/threonine-protein kinase
VIPPAEAARSATLAAVSPPAEAARSATPAAATPPAEAARPPAGPSPATAPAPQRTAEPPRPPSIPAGGNRPPAAAAAPAIRKTGELAVIVRPWAMIWLNGKSLGQTPFRENIAAGRYRLRLSNDDAGKDETTLITVAPDQTTTVQRSW